jgi:glycine cleavage system H protein
MEVIKGNPRLEIHPDLVNREPYGEGWVLRVRLKGMPRWLEAPDYADYLEKGVIVEGA